MMVLLTKFLPAAWAGLAAVAIATPAWGAPTWTGTRTTPHLGEVFAVDATGEQGWIYGAEDVLGDGLATFGPAERSIDLRTAYAATDATRFWARVYVSEPSAASSSIVAFVFIDADRNTATGGGTGSTDLSPAFTTDTSPRGYEYVLGIHGNGTTVDLWEWQTAVTRYVQLVINNPTDASGEAGLDLDPIRIGSSQRAYVQASATLGLVGLTQACNANLYVRSANPTGPSDLDMARTTSCVAARANRVPDILVGATCTTDAQCPQGGVCSSGACVLAPPCGSSADCAASEVCTGDGRCVPKGGASCSSSADCGGLACVNQRCVACTQGGSDCGASARCAPNGMCVGAAASGEHVEGGAFSCSASSGKGEGSALLLLGVSLIVARARRRSRRE